MSIAIYPGSFNPWHAGHQNVLDKAKMIFDKVIIAMGRNPDKDNNTQVLMELRKAINPSCDDVVWITSFDGMLKDFAEKNNATCIIKGLRNPTDLEYEKTQQYWNEDLGLIIPIIYIITDRNLSHVSSSAIRAINKMKGK